MSKITQNIAELRFKERNFVLLDKYINNTTRVTTLCSCGKTFLALPADIFSKHTKSCGHCSDPYVGQRFNQLTITHVKINKTSGCKIECLCDCGQKYIPTHFSQVLIGKTKSCGHCNDPKIGDRFGKLTVIKVKLNNSGGGGCQIKCKCDCGKITDWYRLHRILSGNMKTCGHCNDPNVGDKFYKLTIVDKKENRHGVGCKIKCICDCGKETKWYKASTITGGNTKSCGHCNDPKVGERFNKLTIIEIYPAKNESCSVKCKCECGKITNIMPFHKIAIGNNKSCGHCTDPIVGDKIFSWTVLEVKQSKSCGCKIKCQCDCGSKPIWYTANKIINGHSKTCGDCNNLKIGDVFGLLTVVEIVDIKFSAGCTVICECQCGIRKKILASILRSGRNVSCGNCSLKRNGKATSTIALKLHDIIENITNQKWEHNYHIKGLSCVDIANPELKIAIEYDSYYNHMVRNGDRANNDKLKLKKIIDSGWKVLNIKSGGYDIPTEKQLYKVLLNDFQHVCKKKTITMKSWKKEEEKYNVNK